MMSAVDGFTHGDNKRHTCSGWFISFGSSPGCNWNTLCGHVDGREKNERRLSLTGLSGNPREAQH